ncbi:MAG TPA: hypothetical protein VNO30_09025 [Kofleriaceae bacterium]|nr:hypothetical protein [Kofleriaceae bacterium]
MRARTLGFLSILLVTLGTGQASADLADEEREFGEHVYKSMRAIHDQTCTCKDDGNCKLSVTREELAAQLRRFQETIPTMAPRLWPAVTKKMASMSTKEADAYGERLGQAYLTLLQRKEVMVWARMLSSCWGASKDPPVPNASKPAQRVQKDTPHDGSLDRSGEIHDLKNGRLDEASGIAAFLDSCRGKAVDNPNVEPFCGCLSDYLRVSPPSVIRVLQDASATGNVTELLELPGMKRCTRWVTDGARGKSPYLREGMKASATIEVAFHRCRTSMSNGKPTPSGIVFCNRLVATSP